MIFIHSSCWTQTLSMPPKSLVLDFLRLCVCFTQNLRADILYTDDLSRLWSHKPGLFNFEQRGYDLFFFFIPLNINLYLKCSHHFCKIQFPSHGNTVASATPSPAPFTRIHDALGLPRERGINGLSMLVWDVQGCL